MSSRGGITRYRLPVLLAAAALAMIVASAVIVRQSRPYDEPVVPPVPTTVGLTEALTFPPIETKALETLKIAESLDNETVLPPVPPSLTAEPRSLVRRYERGGETLLLATVNRPVVSGGNEAAVDRINATLTDFCESFVTLSSLDRLLADEAYENDPDFTMRERSADYTVCQRDGVLSILFSISRDVGGPDSETERAAFLFDVTTGERLTFADYTGQEESAAASYLTALYRQDIARSPDIYYSDAAELLPSVLSLTDCFLTDDALVLFVNPGLLAPKAHGLLTIEIPYVAIGR